jgi:hypothetical protein
LTLNLGITPFILACAIAEIPLDKPIYKDVDVNAADENGWVQVNWCVSDD